MAYPRDAGDVGSTRRSRLQRVREALDYLGSTGYADCRPGQRLLPEPPFHQNSRLLTARTSGLRWTCTALPTLLPPPPRRSLPGSVVEWHDPGKMRVPIPKGRGPAAMPGPHDPDQSGKAFHHPANDPARDEEQTQPDPHQRIHQLRQGRAVFKAVEREEGLQGHHARPASHWDSPGAPSPKPPSVC